MNKNSNQILQFKIYSHIVRLLLLKIFISVYHAHKQILTIYTGYLVVLLLKRK